MSVFFAQMEAVKCVRGDFWSKMHLIYIKNLLSYGWKISSFFIISEHQSVCKRPLIVSALVCHFVRKEHLISIARLTAGDPLIFTRSPEGLSKVFTGKRSHTAARFTL